MELKYVTRSAAVLALALMSACVSIDGKGGSDKDARERVTTESLAGSIAPLFAVTNGAAGLKSQDSAFACLDESVSEDGVTLSNDVPDGHYGMEEGGLDVSENTTCEESGLIHWKLDDVTGEDCAGDEMTISGEGILTLGTTEAGEVAVVVLGKYNVDGLDVTCDIVITGDSYSAACETDGDVLETDSCGSDDEMTDSDDSDEDYEDEEDDSFME